METLLESLKQTAAEERTAALVTYRQLLARSNDPQPGDVEDLAELCRTLGIATANVEADLKAMARAASLRSMLLPPGELERLRAEVPACREEGRRALLAAMRRALDAVASFDEMLRVYAVLAHCTGYATLPPNPAEICGRPAAAEDSLHAAEQNNRRVEDELSRLAVDHPLALDAPPPRRVEPTTDLTPHPSCLGSIGGPIGLGPKVPPPRIFDRVTGAAVE